MLFETSSIFLRNKEHILGAFLEYALFLSVLWDVFVKLDTLLIRIVD